MKHILDKFNRAYEYIEFENISIAVIKNDTDNYNFIQYINGLNSYNGGKPIEWIEVNFINAFRELLPKKYNDIKVGDIKNKITIVAIFKHMKKPRFEDQVKSKCINSASMFKDISNDVDFVKLAKLVYKNKDIKDNITEFYDMKAEFEAKKALKGLDKSKPKTIRNEKFMKPIGRWDDIYLAEGDCLKDDTKVLLPNGDEIEIKNLNVNDCIVSSNGSLQTIKAKTTSIRELIRIKTISGIIECSSEHRFYVYDIINKKFIFIKAIDLKKSPNNYKMLKSKVNNNTKYYKVLFNDIENHIMILDNGEVNYTNNDYFIIYNSIEYKRVHATEINPNEYILMI